MINKQALHDTAKELKVLIKTLKGCTFAEVRQQLDKKYERISNRKDKNYNDEFSLEELLKSKTIKKMALKLDKNKVIVFEFIKYEKKPKNIIFFYNEFLGRLQNGIEIYKLKEINE